MKLLLSGGHLTPALALLNFARLQKDEVVFVGRLFSQGKKDQVSHEKEEVEKHMVQFIAFDSGKLLSGALWKFPIECIKSLGAVFRAIQIFLQVKPDAFVSFGGYLAVPLAIAAWVLRVPIITHEQTRVVGVANRFIALFAKSIGVSYEETLHFFPPKKTFFVGNPLRQELFRKNIPTPAWFDPKTKKPLLYITGGSQGSQTINAVVLQMLPKLLQDWCIVHQCGAPTTNVQYKEELERRKSALSQGLQSSYMVFEWLNALEQAWVYTHAYCVVSRAGANTVQELLVLGKPAIFIPLSIAHSDEQTKNAAAVVDTGAALLLPQRELSGEQLMKMLHHFQRNHASLLRQAKVNQKMFDTKADARLYELIQKTVQN